ncbi:MAG: hypothetical protein CVU09_12500 [Bacteroidetes bacterium HGW-Bacteroidetes-4]|jgi:hypothetical protein|nr:MAG: hypothetical protein CVU09_12500 [Bacteroidetes bacterium HGW-Bacteroidetes-4]
MKKLLAVFLLSCIALSISAQKKITEHKVKAISGVALGGESFSPEQVKQKAINDAKIKALKEVGIEENINSYTDFFRAETENTMEELFTSDILSQINGTVKNVEVLSSKPSFTTEGQLKFEVTIKCTVIKYNSARDLAFDAWIEGIKPIYKEGEGLSFTVKPTQPCYVRAFIFTNQSYVLLPNDYEQSNQLLKLTTYQFPDPNLVDSYEMIIENKGLRRELNRLVVVLLKEDLYYTGSVNYKDITDWIMSIPPDERHLESFSFEIYRE